MNVIFEKAEIVSFGKLKNQLVVFGAGANILQAPNESGKSTLAAFIKFVLYGFAGLKNRALSANEKKLYTPWDGEISEGTLYLTADNIKYSIHRKCLASGKENVECIKRATGDSAFSGEIPGEVFFGVGEEVFSRTLFVRGLASAADKDDALADKLRNIAISADEQVGTKKAVAKLNEARNELRGRMLGSGIIPKLERERDDAEAAITEAVSYRTRAQELRNDIALKSKTVAEDKIKLESLAEERRNLENYEAKRKLISIKRAASELAEAEDEYEKASAGLKKRGDGDENKLRSLFSDNAEYVAERKRLDGITNQLNSAEEDIKNGEKLPLTHQQAVEAKKLIEKSKKSSVTVFIIAGAAVLIGAIGFAITHIAWLLVIAVMGIVLAAVGAALLAKPVSLASEYGMSGIGELKNAIAVMPEMELRLSEKQKKLSALRDSFEECRASCNELKRKLDNVLSQYADLSGSDYAEQIETVLRLSSESGKKLAVLRTKREFYEQLVRGVDINELEAVSVGAVEPKRDRQTVDREISFYQQQYGLLSEKLRQSELELASCEAKSGDPAVLVGKRDSLSASVEELSLKYNAYSVAADTINEASDLMKSMVAPRIGSRASVYFQAATGGKYNNLEVDTKLSMAYGSDFIRSVDFLSGGTRDSAYLSLRLALADMLFGGCNVPVIIDDAFDRLDGERVNMMINALSEAVSLHQIIIFAHSSREAEAMEKAGMKYTRLCFSDAV